MAAFLDAYWADRAAGLSPGLGDYLSRHPGAPEAIARCYLALETGSSADTGGAAGGGASLGAYRLIEILGRGGQATVHRAEDLRLGRSVALKVFDRLVGLDEKTLVRFKREARAVSKLSHPGIGKVFDAGVAEGRPFIAMELIEGRSLAELIREEGVGTNATNRDARARIATRLVLLEKVAEALAAAHDQGVIHRDLKPGNVMLRPDGSPVLLDFGLAKIEDDEAPSLTATQDLLGTPAYIAPERLKQPGLPASRLEDVYALGVTAYELIAGQRPFGGATVEETFRQVIRGEAPALDRVESAASRDLAVVVATAMEIDPRRRYQSAELLAADLGRLRRGESVSVRPVGATTRALRWYRRNAVVATLALLILASLTVFSVLTWQKNRRIEDLRREAVERGDDLERSLDEVLVLSDVKRIDDLIAETNSLWPVSPEVAPRFRRWLDRAGRVTERAERHRRALTELEARKIPLDESAIAAAMPEVWAELQAMRDELAAFEDGRMGLEGEQAKVGRAVVADLLAPRMRAYETMTARLEASSYPEAADAWRADILGHLVGQLDRLGGPERGLIQAIRNRLDAAEGIRARTIDAHEGGWEQAAREVAADRRFAGFTLEPISGLVPLGADPDSRLQEFLQLLSHAEEEIPRRDEAGRLPPLTPERGLVLVLVPGGSFQMGSVTERGVPGFDPRAAPIEAPRHEVELAPYMIAKYEIWQSVWLRLAGENPSTHRPGQTVRGVETITETNPVESIGWYDAMGGLARYGLTLPTEAQWERAARGGTTSFWSFGDDPRTAAGRINIVDRNLRELASNAGESGLGDHDDGHALHAPVDSYDPNPYGLYNVHGNVYEWCLDRFSDYEQPVRAGDGLRLGRINASDIRIFRGGAFGYPVDAARSAMRVGTEAKSPDSTIGFRPVLNLAPRRPGRD